MDQLLTPLDALASLQDEERRTPHPGVAELYAQADGNPTLDHVAKMASDLSEAEAYDAQILAGLKPID